MARNRVALVAYREAWKILLPVSQDLLGEDS